MNWIAKSPWKHYPLPNPDPKTIMLVLLYAKCVK